MAISSNVLPILTFEIVQDIIEEHAILVGENPEEPLPQAQQENMPEE